MLDKRHDSTFRLGPILDRDQVQEAAVQRNVRHVGAPGLVRTFDRSVAQQIGVDPVLRVRNRRRADVALLSPRVDVLANLGDERREQLFVRRAAERFVGREPPLRRDERRVRRSWKLRVECHRGCVFFVSFVARPSLCFLDRCRRANQYAVRVSGLVFTITVIIGRDSSPPFSVPVRPPWRAAMSKTASLPPRLKTADDRRPHGGNASPRSHRDRSCFLANTYVIIRECVNYSRSVRSQARPS